MGHNGGRRFATPDKTTALLACVLTMLLRLPDFQPFGSDFSNRLIRQEHGRAL